MDNTLDTLRTAYDHYKQAKKDLYEAEKALEALVIPAPPAIVETHEQVKEFQDTYAKAMQDQAALIEVMQNKDMVMVERLHELERAIPILDCWFSIDDVFIRRTALGGVDIIPWSDVLNYMAGEVRQITDEEVERRR